MSFEDAAEKYETAARMGKPNATLWYSYAVFLWNYRYESDKNTQALEAIEKAIAIKSKPQYIHLKFALLFQMGSFEEAK
ncbi:unnamed protein product [Sphagnum balticum]